jgi:hypothetical protein
MKRDWDLLRAQLTAIEEERDFKKEILKDVPEEPNWTSQSEEVYMAELAAFRSAESRIFGHLELLVDQGYVDGLQVIRSAGVSEFHYGLSSPRLTFAGHDLLDTMRSETLWATIKSTAKTKGIEVTFDSLKALAAIALKGVVGG